LPLEGLTLTLLAVFALAVLFDYINGFHDTANAIATSVSTRALRPEFAILLSAVANFLGALTGTAVAATVGKGIVDIGPQAGQSGQLVIAAALVGAIVWNLVTWRLGIPSSSSHALIGGLIGATFVAVGAGGLKVPGIVNSVLVPLVASPIIGVIGGAALMVLLLNMIVRVPGPFRRLVAAALERSPGWLKSRFAIARHPSRVLRGATPQTINGRFRRLQVISASYMAFSHGSNDAQKTMGIMALALFTAGVIPTFEIPIWVILLAASAISLGTAAGGWRIIKTMGQGVVKLDPIHGFAAETTAATIIFGASHFGMPVSTTHVISSAIIGVGLSDRRSAVRWGVAGNIVIAWILTIPASAAVAALSWVVLRPLFGV
jgi:PiT family inorganic phosphate transporter